jgi:trans-aconitate methyltransferase
MRWLALLNLSWISLLAALPPLQGDERILDLDCGTGEESAYISQLVPDGFVMGVDRSPDAIAFAIATYDPDLFSNLEFRSAPLGKLDLRFDLILTRSSDEEQLKQLESLLTDRGQFFVKD